MSATKLRNAFAVLVGLFLLIEGIMGMSSEMVFGLFSTNTTHAIIHIILGLAGIYYGIKGHSSWYCTFLGILLLVVGLLWFVEGTKGLLLDMLNLNDNVAYLNIAVGAVSLLLAIIASPRRASRA